MQYSVRSIFRPHICGEAVDFDDTGDRIITGAYMKEDPLQVNFNELSCFECWYLDLELWDWKSN